MEKKQACEEQKASHYAKTSNVVTEGRVQLGGSELWKDYLEKATEEIKDISRPIESMSDCDGRAKTQTKLLTEISKRFQSQPGSPTQVSDGQKIWTSIMKDYEGSSPKYKVIRDKNGVTIFKVKLSNGTKLILKSIKVEIDNELKQFSIYNEYYMGMALNAVFKHNTINMLDMKQATIQDGDGKGTMYVFELLMGYGGRSLEKRPEKLNKCDAVKIMYQLLDVLKLMHEQGITHFDIKPQNVTWDGERIKVIDYGTVNSFRKFDYPTSQKLGEYCNRLTGYTKCYIPPEMWKAIGNPKLEELLIPQKYDIFSFGITFMQMLHLEHKQKLYETIGSGAGDDENIHKSYISLIGKVLSEIGEGHWKDFIAQCLEYYPEKRPDYDKAEEAFKKVVANHPDLYSGVKLVDTVTDEVAKRISSKMLADTYYQLKKFHLAIWYYQKCLNEPQNIFNRFIIYNCLGNSYAELGDNDEAEKYLLRAVKIAYEGNAPSAIKIVNNNLGSLYISMKSYANAENCFRLSIRMIGEAKKDDTELASAYNKLSVVYYHEGEYKAAIETATKSLEMQSKLSGAKPNENTAFSHEILLAVHNAIAYNCVVHDGKLAEYVPRIQDADGMPAKELDKGFTMVAKELETGLQQVIDKFRSARAQAELHLHAKSLPADGARSEAAMGELSKRLLKIVDTASDKLKKMISKINPTEQHKPVVSTYKPV
ncbi:MAG: tetratricopeptide repeat-containing serine/threonine-protein kinase, partial [Legionella sp.]|uniref:protein kinase family protein n=1 Tax=Legionella sp. TaxID=459 RepID=UPI0028411A0D|nr:tetratricopeptide repeat-containing serine/threonine-protein kinase [Legionella sp.]